MFQHFPSKNYSKGKFWIKLSEFFLLILPMTRRIMRGRSITVGALSKKYLKVVKKPLLVGSNPTGSSFFVYFWRNLLTFSYSFLIAKAGFLRQNLGFFDKWALFFSIIIPFSAKLKQNSIPRFSSNHSRKTFKFPKKLKKVDIIWISLKKLLKDVNNWFF